MNHIVALSGGADSSAMALRLRELEPDTPFRFVITPTGNELPEMIEHWVRLGQLLGSPLLPVGVAGLESEIERQGALPNWRMRWCTRILKIEPYARFLATIAPAVSYVGLRADEPQREGGDYMDVPGITSRYPLREWNWSRRDVLAYLEQRGITIPKRTDCGLCFFQRLGEWWDLWREHPDRYEQGVQLEDRYDHTFRSEGRDSWPASLRQLRTEFESGRIPRDRAQPDMFEASKCRVCRI